MYSAVIEYIRKRISNSHSDLEKSFFLLRIVSWLGLVGGRDIGVSFT
jgi:hypothetical protein